MYLIYETWLFNKLLTLIFNTFSQKKKDLYYLINSLLQIGKATHITK